MLKKIHSIVENKVVQICAHWDADGITSGAIMYHLTKDYADVVYCSTKGKPFLIEPSDIKEESDIIICVDIIPSPDLLALNKYIIYIDHHPNEDSNLFNLVIHNIEVQSTSILIYNKLLKNTKDPYLIFLTLIGYFGDRGDRETIPQDLLKDAKELIPDFLRRHEGKYGVYLDIERYVSPINAGKRMVWCGDMPLELLKDIDKPEYYTENIHTLAQQLQTYRQDLKESYAQAIEIQKGQEIDYAVINDKRNIQGVLAVQRMKDKPLLILNTSKDTIYGSMRVPDYLDFDAGNFLSKFNSTFESFNGGGHDKAAGMTIDKEELNEFLEILKN